MQDEHLHLCVGKQQTQAGAQSLIKLFPII